ncbi:hypothetical protein Ahy_A06g030166 isoform C [Arachis hypogaea]|uniref:SET domain-containing protein n=1 Tax=Arachis hypogaea TaxID=3818 RepID=A0A445CVG1_ARAHY|nr:hypothetical protein Ahy_A06g030166 isoform C [Arachis hypogaea]
MHSNFKPNHCLSFVFSIQHALVNLDIFSIPKLFLRDPKAAPQKLMSWFPSGSAAMPAPERARSMEGKKKQNLKCVRFDVNGECRVLLIANRDISKGERLYYDYNGYEHEYPTEHFV